MSVTHTDVDDNPIPITFDLTLMLLDHHKTNTYSHNIQDWLKRHPIRVIDIKNPSAIRFPFTAESIRIGWTGSGVDIWSNKRLFDAEDPPKLDEKRGGVHICPFA